MKKIILDSGPVISLALNNLLWLLEEVKKKFNIIFYTTESVKKELVDNPINSKRFKFEALQVMNLMRKGVIEVISDEKITEKTNFLLQLANSSYKAKNKLLTLVHYPEVSAISASLILKADAVMIDERTTRYIIERPDKLGKVLEHKLHTKVSVNKKTLAELRKHTRPIKFIRSAEFVTLAFEKGLLNDYLPDKEKPRSTLLDALLWGMKLNGCAISTKDLEALKKIELKRWKRKDS